ncbi:MAG: radical SAM protein [Nitrospirota bacterium]
MNLAPLARLAYRAVRSNITEPDVPYRLTISLTNRCQARCTMCDIWQKPEGNELTLKEIAALFRNAKRFSWINLTGGEIFLRSDIRNIMHAIITESPDLYLMNFPTNGLLTRDIVDTVDSILETTRIPRLIVTISLDGPRDVHDLIRGVPGIFDSAVATFEALRKRRSRRFSVFFGYTLQMANITSFDDTLLSVREKLGDCSIDDFHMNMAHVSEHYYGNARFEGIPDASAAVDILQRISRLRNNNTLDPVAFLEHRYQRIAETYLMTGSVPLVCEAASASCFIDPGGTVYPCIGLGTAMGSLRDIEYDLYGLWRTSIRSRIRQAARSGDCPGCWTPCEAYQTLLANLVLFPGRQV